MFRTREAVADGGGDSGMRRSVGVLLPALVVVDAGMLAMTAERIVSGDTPRVTGVQPVSDTMDTTAIAPCRGLRGVTMREANARTTPG